MINIRQLSRERHAMEMRLAALCDFVARSGVYGEKDFREVLRLDAMAFLLYLANVDGNLAKDELDCVSALFCYRLTKDKWQRYMEERGITDEDYPTKVPFSLHTILEAEKAVPFRGYHPSKIFVENMFALSETVLQAGTNLLSRGNGAQARARRDAYIDFLVTYSHEHLQRKWQSRDFRYAFNLAQSKEIAKIAPNYDDFKQLLTSMQEATQTRIANIGSHRDGYLHFLRDLEDFAVYIISADGHISPDETTMMRFYLDTPVDAVSLQESIHCGSLEPAGILERCPQTMEDCIRDDRYMAERGNASFKSGPAIIKAFEAFGKEFIIADSKTTRGKLTPTCATSPTSTASTRNSASSREETSWRSTAPGWSADMWARPPSRCRR